MKNIGNVKRQFADKDNTPINLWWPRIVGIGLAVILSAFFFVQTSPIAMLVVVVVVAAIAFFWKGIAGVIAVRWCARTVGVVSAIVIATIFIGESVGGQGPGMTTIIEWVFVSMWVAVFVGIVITFFWEGIGGMLVALAALALVINAMMSFHVALDTISLTFMFVGLASVYCWWRTRRLSLTSQPAT